MVWRGLLWVVVLATAWGCARDEEPDLAEAVERAERKARGAAEAQSAEAQARKNRPVGDYWSLLDERTRLDRTVWSNEVLAQQYEDAFVELWDALRYSADPENKFEALANFPFETLTVREAGKTEELDWGIGRTRFDQGPQKLTRPEFHERIQSLATRGYRLVETEWHHAEFDPPDEKLGLPARSTVSFVLHVDNRRRSHRAIVRGRLKVEWSNQRSKSGSFLPKSIAAVDVLMLDTDGKPAFEPLVAVAPPRATTRFVLAEPFLLYDLDGDGLTEIIVGGRNLVLRNRGGGQLQEEKFSPRLPQIENTALVADLTGDGNADFAFVDRDGGLSVLPGDERGKFDQPPLKAWPGKCEAPITMTAGDIDRDGDLDLFLAQYRAPYEKGQMPTPYYDANDGLPAYLLQNDGSGRFSDATERAGLGKRRNRRTYGASLIDLDDDGALDLIVTSDFAGIDLYRGDGKGTFSEVTDRWVDERHNFGMAHTFADYDRDGRLDFYVIGMSSTTARRLDYMKLVRDDRADVHRMRARMGYGNRMYLARNGRFLQPAWNDDVARTGWSWGATSFDFDLDGDVDVYVANGHRSGASARDYCTRFWCHDLYTGSSEANESVRNLFRATMEDLHAGQSSWNGFEHNALLMNLGGKGFADVGFLMGVSFEFDARGVASDDLDNDGRPELLVVENKAYYGGVAGSPENILRQTLHVLANRFESPQSRRWIGVRLRQGRGGASPLGARIVARSSSGPLVARIVAGDSLYCQHAPKAVFGLAADEDVAAIEVRWPDGTTDRLEHPAADRYHDFTSGK